MSDQTIQSSDGLILLPAIVELADTYKLSAKAFAFTFRAVAMPQPHTEAEFVSCALVAREHQLNPLTKEIYFMRTKAGPIQPIVSVDGWIKKCNEHPQYDGMEITDAKDENGNILEMTISIFRKDRARPTTITEYMDECSKNGGPVWRTSPKRMLRNRTICQGARIAFGFAGIMDRDEFDQWQAMKDVTPRADRIVQSNTVPEIPEVPDVPAVPEETQASPDDDPKLSPDQEQLFLEKLSDEVAVAGNSEAVQEIADQYADVLERMSDEGRRAAEKIIEGRG